MRSTFDIYADAFREFWMIPGVIARMATMDAPLPPVTRYNYGEHRRQYLLVYPPQPNVKPRNEVAYFIHGGGWRVGSPERRRPLVHLLTRLGYTVMLPAYRLTPSYGFPDLHADTFNAFAYAQHLPESKGKDFILMGESAGGSLGALLAWDQEGQERYQIEAHRFRGFLSMVGVLDLDPMPDTFVVRDFADAPGSLIYQKANPINYISKDRDLPVLALHGDEDGLVPHTSAQNFVQKHNALHPGKGELILVPGGNHISTGTDWYLEANARTRRVLDWMEEIV